eukprot:2281815-Rhodomonas_salina.3
MSCWGPHTRTRLAELCLCGKSVAPGTEPRATRSRTGAFRLTTGTPCIATAAPGTDVAPILLACFTRSHACSRFCARMRGSARCCDRPSKSRGVGFKGLGLVSRRKALRSGVVCLQVASTPAAHGAVRIPFLIALLALRLECADRLSRASYASLSHSLTHSPTRSLLIAHLTGHATAHLTDCATHA